MGSWGKGEEEERGKGRGEEGVCIVIPSQHMPALSVAPKCELNIPSNE